MWPIVFWLDGFFQIAEHLLDEWHDAWLFEYVFLCNLVSRACCKGSPSGGSGRCFVIMVDVISENDT